MTDTTGELRVLNVGHGDLRFTFNKDNAIELEKARRCITDMLRRGYALFIEVDGENGQKKTVIVKSFDPERECYIIGDTGAAGAVPVDETEFDEAKPSPRRSKKPATRMVPMRTSKATAVAPTAGG